MKRKIFLTTAIICALLLSTIAAPQTIRAQVAPPKAPPATIDDEDVQPPPDEETPKPNEKPAPKVAGKPFEQPQYAQPKVSKAELYTQVGLSILQLVIANMQKPPQPRQRGENVRAAGCGGAGYQGRCDVYQFVNADFPSKNSCGQAAMATAMWNLGLTMNNDAAALARSVYYRAPPKITLANIFPLSNNLGTDWHQVNYGMDAFKNQGIKYTWVEGEAEIKKYLAMNLPVLIMLDAGTLPQFDYKWWFGHWVTAFGYDRDYIYVSNFQDNRMTWKQLGDAFRDGTLAKGHGTSGKAMVVWKWKNFIARAFVLRSAN